MRARTTAMEMADGNVTEMASAMVDGDCNGNCQWQQRWGWAMGDRNGNGKVTVTESTTATEMATVIAMARAMARATMTKGGLPFHVPAMCSTVAGATPCLHPHGHKGKCIFTSAASWG